MSGRNNIVLLSLVVSVLPGYFPFKVYAAQWSLKPSVDVSAQYDDNIRLTTADPKSVTSGSVSPSLIMGRYSTRSDVELEALLDFSRYSDSEEEATHEERLNLKSKYRITERSNFYFDATYRQDSLLRSVSLVDLREAGISTGFIDVEDTDLGLAKVKVKRQRVTARPRWSVPLTERTSAVLGYRLTDVTFTDDLGTGLVDYNEHAIDAGLQYRLSEKDSVNINTSFSRYEADAKDSRADKRSVTAGVDHTFTETTKGGFKLGLSNTKETSGSQQETTSGVVSEAYFLSRMQVMRIRGTVRREVNPSGTGRVLLSDRMILQLTRNMSPRARVAVAVDAFRNQALQGSAADDRTYYSIRPSWSYLLTRNWNVDLSYRYRREKYDQSSDFADSNAIFLATSYAWIPVSVSR